MVRNRHHEVRIYGDGLTGVRTPSPKSTPVRSKIVSPSHFVGIIMSFFAISGIIEARSFKERTFKTGGIVMELERKKSNSSSYLYSLVVNYKDHKGIRQRYFPMRQVIHLLFMLESMWLSCWTPVTQIICTLQSLIHFGFFMASILFWMVWEAASFLLHENFFIRKILIERKLKKQPDKLPLSIAL